MVISSKVKRNERERRLKYLHANLTSEEKNAMPKILADEWETKAGYTSICNYLSLSGNNYWTEMAIILCGEKIISERKK